MDQPDSDQRGKPMNDSNHLGNGAHAGDTSPAPGQQVRLRVDERQMATNYANAFRTHATPEELMLDLGINTVQPAPAGSAGGDGNQPQAELVMRTSNRIIMNYFTAKRLAITLSQAIRRHESQFGEIKLDVNERARGANG